MNVSGGLFAAKENYSSRCAWLNVQSCGDKTSIFMAFFCCELRSPSQNFRGRTFFRTLMIQLESLSLDRSKICRTHFNLHSAVSMPAVKLVSSNPWNLLRAEILCCLNKVFILLQVVVCDLYRSVALLLQLFHCFLYRKDILKQCKILLTFPYGFVSKVDFKIFTSEVFCVHDLMWKICATVAYRRLQN